MDLLKHHHINTNCSQTHSYKKKTCCTKFLVISSASVLVKGSWPNKSSNFFTTGEGPCSMIMIYFSFDVTESSSDFLLKSTRTFVFLLSLDWNLSIVAAHLLESYLVIQCPLTDFSHCSLEGVDKSQSYSYGTGPSHSLSSKHLAITLSLIILSSMFVSQYVM